MYWGENNGNMNQGSFLQNGTRFDTIVIGGGIGGVTAAVELAKIGQRVAILQANNYLGGRLKTTPLDLLSGGQIQFDEGASWIHGSSRNHPITKLSKSVQNVFMKETDDDNKVEVYGENGDDVQKQVDKAWNAYEKLLDKCEDEDYGHSIQDAFKKRGNGCLNDKFFMYHVANDIQFETSGSISQLGANGYDDDVFNGREMLILSGYQRFPQALLNEAKVQVYLNQKVRRVVWKEGESELVCENGLTVYARNTVIAVPIGVLKNNTIQFVPALPDWKNEAIQSIGFGNVCKILVEFNKDNLFKSNNHYIGVVSDNVNDRGLCTYFLNLKALGGMNALMTFGLGGNADQAERMPENELKMLLAKRMSAFAEQKISPADFRIYRTCWRGNQNFLGTYSFASTKTRPKHWENMAKPVLSSNWYFCGEHTFAKYRGTVHGAYLSGVSAANLIKNKTSQQVSQPQLIKQNNQQNKNKKKNRKRKQSSSSSSSN